MPPASAVHDDPRVLYGDAVKRWARQVRVDRRLRQPDLSISRTSRICGSTVTLDICHRGEIITALGYRTRACSLGMAATAVLVHTAPGRGFQEVGLAGQWLADLLTGAQRQVPAGWEALLMFSAARTLVARHGSILLPFDIISELAAVTMR